MAGLIGAVWGWKEGRMQNPDAPLCDDQILNFKGKFGKVRYIIPQIES